ncbi:Uncharacterised protein [Afipia felis]|uniref:Uncharacterized protein n=2 Tax=Afipia felis TaxID=1035 RepID=A0A380W4M8_AFIFE|nr:hypothetical protein HMPREF9697_03641 [Afipia felis ATCC 53690]SUU75857.1 Uncharacterised protein [Afipia felis]SUU83924.1 Uncharacterised protein [Afipia felis]
MRPSILTFSFVTKAFKEVGDGVGIFWTGRIEIVVSRNDNCGPALSKGNHTLNGLLRLSLPKISSAYQYIKGFHERWNLLEFMPLEVEI